MSERDEIICSKHGGTPTTFVCRHLFGGVACGFHASTEDPHDPWPDAWCDLCEEMLQAAGGEWNEESEKLAGIKVLCTHCYEDARARNRNVPRLARGKRVRLSDREAADLVHHALHEVQALQDASIKRLDWSAMAWQLDSEASTIIFSDETKKLIADVRFVGSFSRNTNTFQWAWKSYDEDAHEARASSYLRVFGEVRGMSKLTTANFPCDETTGWEMVTLAAYLLGADGFYRAPIKHVRWFMLLSNWRAPN